MGSYARFIIRHRWAVLALIVVATLFLVRASSRLHVEVDADRQLPQDHPYIQTLNEVHRLFGDKNLVVVGLFPHDGNVFTPQFLRKLADVTERIRKVPGANQSLVQSLAAPQVKDIRGTADGLDVDRVMETPPDDAAGAEEVRKRAFDNDAYVGTLVAKDGSAAAVQASFELTPDTPGYLGLYKAIVAQLEAADDGSFDYKLSGPVVFMAQLSVYAARMATFFPLALLVIGLIHYHAFRTLQALFLPLLTAILSVVWALGFMGLVGVSLDPLNTTTPILILAVAAGHAVQILKRFYEEYDRTRDVNEAIVVSLERVGPVMLAAGTVAALSFGSLVTFRTATIRTFGIFTGFGIISALLIEMTLIPAVRASLPAPRGREREREAEAHPWIDAFLGASARLAAGPSRRGVVTWAVLIVVACAALFERVHVEMSLKRQFRDSDRVRVEDAALNERFTGTNTLVFLVKGDGEGTLEEPAIMGAIYGLERRLEQEPGVGKAISYVDFVRKMHLAMNADRPDMGDLPAKRALTAQYLFLYSLSGGSEDFDAYIDPSHTAAKVRVLLHEDSTAYGQRMIALAKDEVARTFPPGYTVNYTGTLASTAAGLEVMVAGKLRNILQIAVITFLIASLLLRSWIAGLLVVTPLALTVAVNFGIMGIFGIPLDTITSAISAMAVGIGADYAMYLLFRVREEVGKGQKLQVALRAALMTSGKAILFVSTAIAGGYGMLCLSGFKFHIELGALVALAMVVSSFATIVLLPSLIMQLRPAFLVGRETPAWAFGVEMATTGTASTDASLTAPTAHRSPAAP